MTQALETYREKAMACGLPDSVAAWWIGLARPSAELCRDGDGPVVGRFGGMPPLPPGVDWPRTHDGGGWLSFFADVDLAALSEACADLGLPADGRLLLFANPLFSDECAVIHLDSAQRHEAETGSADAPYELCAPYPLHFRPHWTLPLEAAEIDGMDDEQWEKYAEQYDLETVHSDIGARHTWSGGIVLGGHTEPYSGYDDPAERGWTLLAQANTDEILHQMEDYEECNGMLWWVLPTEDLAARRFDRVQLGSVVDPP